MRKLVTRTALTLLPAIALLASPRLLARGEKPRDPGIAEGIRLHDQGRYDEAIARYREVLARNPDDVGALYELAYTYEAKKDWAAALETAKRGVTIDDALRPQLYIVIGNIYDEMGQGADAIAAYRSGIHADPRIQLLHFNLGVAYLRRESWREGRRALQQAALLKPEHASTHYYLGYAYEKENLKAPAFLAYVRFLLLEPGTARSREALRSVDSLFQRGYEKEPTTGNVTLTVNSEQPKEDEGDFTTMELAMLMAQTVHAGMEKPPTADPAAATAPATPERPRPVERTLVALSGAGANVSDDAKGFAETYYLPFFRGLEKSDLLETAAYVSCRGADVPEVAAWLEAHASNVEALQKWSASFAWSGPAAKP